MPLTQRVPKLRGFYNRFRVEYEVVNCGKLARFEAGAVVDVEQLVKAGLVGRSHLPIKLLAGGGAPPALTIRVNRASRAAIDAVTKAGGAVELLDEPKPKPEEGEKSTPSQRRRAASRAKLASAEEPVGDPQPGTDESQAGGQESST